MLKNQIVVVIPTKNEELAIRECVEAAQRVGRVVVVDSHSSDRTEEVASDAGAEVVRYAWDGGYPKKKQWCLDNVAVDCDWVMFVDADELVSDGLAREVLSLRLDDVAGVLFKISYAWQGKVLAHGYTVQKLALMNRHRVRFPVVDDLEAPGMGEQEGHYQPVLEGRVVSVRNRLDHRDPDPLSSWVARHNRYSDWDAYLSIRRDARDAVASAKTLQGRVFARAPFKPIAFFIYAYIFKRGFLDGRAGLDYAVANSFYYWLISVKRREASSPHSLGTSVR